MLGTSGCTGHAGFTREQLHRPIVWRPSNESAPARQFPRRNRIGEHKPRQVSVQALKCVPIRVPSALSDRTQRRANDRRLCPHLKFQIEPWVTNREPQDPGARVEFR